MKPKTVGRVTGGPVRPQHAQELCHGLPVGLTLLTADGEIPVEYVAKDDKVVTRNAGLIPVLETQSETLSTRAIKFTQACFGTSGPASDVILPAQQPILVRDWRARALFGQSQAMTTANQLVDDEFITDIGPRRMNLIRLVFDRPRVIYAAGLELGSAAHISLPVRFVA